MLGHRFPGSSHLVRLAVLAGLLGNALTLAEPAMAQAKFDAAAEQQLLALINQARSERGLPRLTMDQRLTQAARDHTLLMVKHRTLSHQFPDEAGLEVRFADRDLHSDQQAENVGVGEDPESVHDGFMRSSGHRANILQAQYNVAGIGVVQSGRELFVTEDFARRVVEYSQPQAETALLQAIQDYDSAHGIIAPVSVAEPQLRSIACNMALNDMVDGHEAAKLPGVRQVLTWTAADPRDLPRSLQNLLLQGTLPGFALGACFAPSVSHPGGVYWLVVIVY